MSNFPCSLARNITPHSMKNLAFHSLHRWKMFILSILTTSPIYFFLKGWENLLLFLPTRAGFGTPGNASPYPQEYVFVRRHCVDFKDNYHVLIIFLGGGVPPGPENPYLISDQNIRFSIPYFRSDSQNVYPISDPVMCGTFSNSHWIYGVRDFVTPQTMFVFIFSSRSMSAATDVTLKMISQTKQTEDTPYFRPKWPNLYPISD